MNVYRKLFVTIAIALGFAAVACQPDTTAERVADEVESAGEELQSAAEDVRNEVEDACEEVKQEAGAADTDC